MVIINKTTIKKADKMCMKRNTFTRLVGFYISAIAMERNMEVPQKNLRMELTKYPAFLLYIQRNVFQDMIEPLVYSYLL
jgi:hypothetical protein